MTTITEQQIGNSLIVMTTPSYMHWVWDPMAGGDSRMFEDTPEGLKSAIAHAEAIIEYWNEQWVQQIVVVKRVKVRENVLKGKVVWRKKEEEKE
jgi:hypothetical protein